MIRIRIFTLAAMVEEVVWDQSSSQRLIASPDQPSDATITINSILKHSTSDVQKDPVFKSWIRQRDSKAADLQNYVHNMFDLIYMLEYLEGQSIVNKLSVYQKMAALRKLRTSM